MCGSRFIRTSVEVRPSLSGLKARAREQDHVVCWVRWGCPSGTPVLTGLGFTGSKGKFRAEVQFHPATPTAPGMCAGEEGALRGWTTVRYQEVQPRIRIG